MWSCHCFSTPCCVREYTYRIPRAIHPRSETMHPKCFASSVCRAGHAHVMYVRAAHSQQMLSFSGHNIHLLLFFITVTGLYLNCKSGASNGLDMRLRTFLDTTHAYGVPQRSTNFWIFLASSNFNSKVSSITPNKGSNILMSEQKCGLKWLFEMLNNIRGKNWSHLLFSLTRLLVWLFQKNFCHNLIDIFSYYCWPNAFCRQATLLLFSSPLLSGVSKRVAGRQTKNDVHRQR